MVSLDGSSHVYNATLINHLLFSEKSVINDFVEFNHVVCPNWSGHAIMSIFQWFVSPVMSEKLLVLFILIFTPYSFRYLIRSFPNGQIIGSYIVFLFSYSAFQFLGFYNFLVSLIPFFYLLGYVFRKGDDLKFKNFLVISVLLLLVYFSHAFVFLLSLLSVGLIVLFFTFKGFHSWNQWFNRNTKKLFFLFLAMLPSCLLFVLFIQHKPSFSGGYLSIQEINNLFLSNSSFVSIANNGERYTQPILILFGVLFVFALYYRIKEIIEQKRTSHADVFFILVLMHVFFVFYLPDTDGWGGYYTLRSLFCLNIIAMVFVMAVRYPVRIKMVLLLIALIFQGIRIKRDYKKYKELQPFMEFIEQAGNRIEKDALVVSVNLGTNLAFGHISTRLAAQNKAIAVDNYEMTMNYFPLAWKLSTMPEPVVPDTLVPKRVRHWPLFDPNTKKRMIDYILVFGDLTTQTEPELILLQQITQKSYVCVMRKFDISLYKLNQNRN